MNGLDGLRGHGRMTWIDAEQGWVAALDEVVDALSSDGFEECKREVTTSRRDSEPAGSVWQGINKPQALVFLTMDGESLRAGLTVEKPEGA